MTRLSTTSWYFSGKLLLILHLPVFFFVQHAAVRGKIDYYLHSIVGALRHKRPFKPEGFIFSQMHIRNLSRSVEAIPTLAVKNRLHVHDSNVEELVWLLAFRDIGVGDPEGHLSLAWLPTVIAVVAALFDRRILTKCSASRQW